MQPLRQLYDDQGRSLEGQGATKNDVLLKGLLHGASHVWLWRQVHGGCEILLQKRSASKRTWPNLYDISAAGHIDLGETPIIAALRETQEEIGVDIKEADLKLICVHRAYMRTDNGDIENEFQWVYIYKLGVDTDFNLRKREVSSLEWKTLQEFKKETQSNTGKYVPHGSLYFDTVIAAIEAKL